MSVEAIDPQVDFVSGGLTYNFDYVFQANGDITVELIDNTHAITTLEEGVDYTLSNTDPGGVVTLLSEPTAGLTVRIKRVTDANQPTNMPTTGVVATSTFEDMTDRATLIIQELKYKVDNKTVKVPATFDTEVFLPEPEAGLPLKWNDAATGLETVSWETLAAALVNVLSPNTILTPVTTIYAQLAAGNNWLNPLPNDTRTAAQWMAAYPNITQMIRYKTSAYSVWNGSTGTNFVVQYTATDPTNMFIVVCSAAQNISYTPAPITPINRFLSLLGLTLTGLVEYADNAAAVGANQAIGTVYRTGDALKVVHA